MSRADTPAEEPPPYSHRLSSSRLLETLDGVVVATKRSDLEAVVVRAWIGASNDHHSGINGSNTVQNGISEDQSSGAALTFVDWKTYLTKCALQDRQDICGHLAGLTLAVTFLREQSRSYQSTSAAELATAWDLIRNALNAPSAGGSPSFGHPSRSAQGFIAIPLCSLIVNGLISELFRLHVWLPDAHRGRSELAVHSHQPWAQSWILAGSGINHVYDAEIGVFKDKATHAAYALSWSDGQTNSTKYVTHQKHSVVVNTGIHVGVKERETSTQTANMSYVVPSATFHRTEVDPDSLHATLFFFDASRGFYKDAKVLGPVEGGPYIQERLVAGVTAQELIGYVDEAREDEQARSNAANGVKGSDIVSGKRSPTTAALPSSLRNVEKMYECAVNG